MDKLHEIASQHKALSLMVEKEEMTFDDVKDTFEALEGEIELKSQSLVEVIDNMDCFVYAAEQEVKRLNKRIKAIKNRQESFRHYLKFNMQNTGISKISCPLFTITLVRGTEMAIVDDEEALDDKFVSVEVITKPDKKKLLAALKLGEIEGAHIERGEQSLRIK